MKRGVKVVKGIFRYLADGVRNHPWLPLIGALVAIKLMTAAAWKFVQTVLAMIAYALLVVTGVAVFRSIRPSTRREVKVVNPDQPADGA